MGSGRSWASTICYSCCMHMSTFWLWYSSVVLRMIVIFGLTSVADERVLLEVSWEKIGVMRVAENTLSVC